MPNENKTVSMQAELEAQELEKAKAIAANFTFKTQPMFLDKRPIRGIEQIGTNDPVGWEVDQDGITLIELYGENGPVCMLPWLAVWKGEQVIFRAPAQGFMVSYGESH